MSRGARLDNLLNASPHKVAIKQRRLFDQQGVRIPSSFSRFGGMGNGKRSPWQDKALNRLVAGGMIKEREGSGQTPHVRVVNTFSRSSRCNKRPKTMRIAVTGAYGFSG